MSAERFWAAEGVPAGPGGIYRGWYNVAFGVLGVMLVAGATAYSFGLFIKPVSEELGLSRATTNLGLALFHLGSALSAPFVGRLLDRYPIQNIQRVGATLFGIGLVAIGFSSSPIVLALLIIGPVAFGAVASSALFANVLATRWFVDLRARALTIVAMGTSLGGLVVFPAIGFLIQAYSWRTALIVAGISIALILWLISFLVRDRPPMAEKTAASDQPQTELEAAETVRLTPWKILAMRDFWFISLSGCLLMGVDQALLATITPYMQDRNFSLAQVAAIMSATTGSAIAGKLLIAAIADRFDLRLLLGLTAICSIAMCIVLVLEASFAGLFISSCLTGLAIGGTFPLANAMIARRFGAASVGTALGLKMPVLGVASIGALYFVGFIHDRDGSYDNAFLIFAGIAAAAILMMPFIRLPRPAVKRRDEIPGAS